MIIFTKVMGMRQGMESTDVWTNESREGADMTRSSSCPLWYQHSDSLFSFLFSRELTYLMLQGENEE